MENIQIDDISSIIRKEIKQYNNELGVGNLATILVVKNCYKHALMIKYNHIKMHIQNFN